MKIQEENSDEEMERSLDLGPGSEWAERSFAVAKCELGPVFQIRIDKYRSVRNKLKLKVCMFALSAMRGCVKMEIRLNVGAKNLPCKHAGCLLLLLLLLLCCMLLLCRLRLLLLHVLLLRHCWRRFMLLEVMMRMHLVLQVMLLLLKVLLLLLLQLQDMLQMLLLLVGMLLLLLLLEGVGGRGCCRHLV